ncbi:MAG: hypothetical protein WC872_00550 [Candidatus Absconditabacterales bacterium]
MSKTKFYKLKTFGGLFFVPASNYGNFENPKEEGIEITKEILDWILIQPIKGGFENLEKKSEKIYKDGIQALFEISLLGFEVIISIGIDLENKKVFLPKPDGSRVHCYINLKKEEVVDDKIVIQEQNVVAFNTSRDGTTFSHLYQWPDKFPNWEQQWEVAKWSSAEAWKKFFVQKIKKKANDLIDDGTRGIEEAHGNISDAQRIIDTLI